MKKDEMAEPTYDEILKASLNSKRLLYRQLISSFMIKFLCNVEVNQSIESFDSMDKQARYKENRLKGVQGRCRNDCGTRPTRCCRVNG